MPSPTTRKTPVAAARASTRLFRLRCRIIHAADVLEPLLQAEPIEAPNRQCCEDADALMQHPVGILERQGDFGGGTLCSARIGNAPMRRHRLPRPHRTAFAGRVVADGESEIERGRTGLGEFIPGLRTKRRGVVVQALQEPNGMWVHLPVGVATGAASAEFSLPKLVQDGL